MKKLMIAAAAAVTATIGFSVESSNIVGYKSADLIDDGGLSAGACFIPVTGSTIDLGDLKVTGYTGETDSEVELQTLDEYGDSDRSFLWKDTSLKFAPYTKFYGWYEDGDTPYDELDDEDKVLLAPGQGVFSVTYGSDFTLQSAGAVATGDIETPLVDDGGLIIVNPTPVAVDLGSCIVTGYEGESDSEVEIQTLDEYGDSDRSYLWKDTSLKFAPYTRFYGWYLDGDEAYDDLDDGDKFTIAPGNGAFAVTYGSDFNFKWPGVTIGE